MSRQAAGRCTQTVITYAIFQVDIRQQESRYGSRRAARLSGKNMTRQHILPCPEIPLDSGLFNQAGRNKQTKNEFVFIVLGGSIGPPFFVEMVSAAKKPNKTSPLGRDRS